MIFREICDTHTNCYYNIVSCFFYTGQSKEAEHDSATRGNFLTDSEKSVKG